VNSGKGKYVISLGALCLLIMHLVWPKLGIDIITIALLFIAALPFSSTLLKMLASSGVKNLELPGGIKIEMADAKAATDKVNRGWGNVVAPAPVVSGTITSAVPETPQSPISIEDPVAYIREVANKDANLSLVAFRIEIEKRIRTIAENNQVKSERTSLGRLIREMQNQNILPPEVSGGLMDLVALGNRAAHGAEVDPNAADWVLDFGASIILKLDSIISEQTTHNN
jgi:hypothetical protein